MAEQAGRGDKFIRKVLTLSFFIRNHFIRNQGSTHQKIKKVEGWNVADLRNFQIKKIGNSDNTRFFFYKNGVFSFNEPWNILKFLIY